MDSRITDKRALQGLYSSMLGLTANIEDSPLGNPLYGLVTMRASQINGCAVCLDMHARELREAGEREDRIYVLNAWRETSWFTERERAALAWTEAVTTLTQQQVAEDVYQLARAHFSEAELVDLTQMVIAINGWNRINIAFANQPRPLTAETVEAGVSSA